MPTLGLPGEQAVVVFSDRADLGWLRVLRRGYRHCFVVLRGERGWIAVEALSNGTVVSEHPDASPRRLMAAYRRAGHRAVVVRCRAAERKPLPWSPFTCVESVKRLIGLRAPSVWTPYQLRKRLSNKIGKNT